MKKITLISLTFLCSVLYSQTGISGLVIDGEFNDVLPFANVVVVETSDGTTTDFDGKYFIDLSEGKYTIEFSFVGYEKKRISELIVTQGKITNLDVVLNPAANSLEEVVVTTTAKRNTESAVLNIQKNASVVLDGLSIQAIKKAGDGDIASAVKRVPGISVQGGKYVFVRGLGDRYSKTMLNFLELPGIDPDRNTLPLDIFPTSIIENIIVQKSASASRSADFTGGLVNIKLKNYSFSPEYNISYSVGYNPDMNLNNSFLRDKISKTDWRGIDNGQRKLGLDPTAELPPALFFLPTSGELTKATRTLSKTMVPIQDRSDLNYNINLSASNSIQLANDFRLGYIASIGYKSENLYYDNYIDNTAQKFRGDINFYSQQISQLGQTNKFLSGLFGLTLQNGFNKISINILRLQNSESNATNLVREEYIENNYLGQGNTLTYTERSLFSMPIQGSHRTEDDKIEFNWAISKSNAVLKDKDFRRTVFEKDPLDDIFYFSPNQVSAPGRIWRNLYEKSGQYKFDLKFNFNLNNDEKSSVIIGASNSNKSREFNSQKYDVWYLGDSTILNGDPNAFFFEENIWTRENRRGTYLRGGQERTNIYESKIKNSAHFFETELAFSKSLKLVLGIRNELFELFYTGEDLPGNQYLNSKFIDTNDNFVYGNTIIRLSEKSNLRISYYETIARPSFREASTAYIYNPISETFFLGNINVKPSYIDNYDLRYEVFGEKNQMFAFSLFFKDFFNPIEIVTFDENSPNTFIARNVGDASVKGVELEIRKNIIDNERFLSSLSLNATVIDATQTMSNSEYISKLNAVKDELNEGENFSKERSLQGQSPYIFNAGINNRLLDKDLEFGLFFNVQGETLSNVGIGGVPDVYTKPFNRLDFSLKKVFEGKISKTLTFRANNLLNDNREQVYKWLGEDTLIFNSYSPGITFSLGYSLKF